MSANGIRDLALKRDRQEQKLLLAEAKRKGQIITEGNGIWSTDGIDNPLAPYYRPLNTLDLSRLPTRYSAVSNSSGDVVNNPGPNLPSRPWT